MTYNWQQEDWPNFQFQLAAIEDALFAFAGKAGHVSGVLKALPEDTQMEAIIDILVSEAIKTSEIEGEYLSRKDVMSSVRNNLGLNKINDLVLDRRAAGISEMMISVRNSYRRALTAEQLFAWHKMLIGSSTKIAAGQWRSHSEPMQIVSGIIGKERVHFEAPPSARIPQEMEQFISWFNDSAPGGKNEIKKAPVRSAIAHLYFESIHPFEDGNGRIGRAIAEKALSQSIGAPVFLSLSRTIESRKKDYYSALQASQGSNEITAWINYFVGVILDAQNFAGEQINFALQKTKFFDQFRDVLSGRQLKVVKRVLEEGSGGFQGGMNANKYASLTKVSKATATRDLQDLLQKGVLSLSASGGGRSTKYDLNI